MNTKRRRSLHMSKFCILCIWNLDKILCSLLVGGLCLTHHTSCFMCKFLIIYCHFSNAVACLVERLLDMLEIQMGKYS